MSRGEQVEGRKRVAARRGKLQGVISDSIIKTKNPRLPLNGNMLYFFKHKTYSCMTTWCTYLQVPAHQELPERAQPPSVMRPLVHFLLSPEGGDVIWRLGK